ncbi:tryptophan-rich sensory protein [Rhodococcus rhodnii]|uniref:Tryptophan-rich sensory protein n=2 Tax=Rhodococcus rhodnii TaxID=38312 RepID=R7WH03_9NOCA|nr:tryptophan-rich sensory protein [Rhodococcus rhodnii]EOM74292.1 hypothetical protein Rrhod_4436 [Rhodococcus rhodnii LMG 5362]TXG89567.1 tryptophan-rich sensory protein [Rhodococcus rhodnii]
MSERAVSDRTSPPESRDTVRVVGVFVAAVLAIAGSFVGSGAVVGTPVSEAAGGLFQPSSTAVAPASPAFSIWTVVYIGFVAYAILQALPAYRRDPRQRAVGWWAAAAMLLNAVWILAVQLDALWVSAVVIVVLLLTLLRVFTILVATRPAAGTSPIEATVVDGTMNLYLGWVCVAVVANLAAALASVSPELGLGAEPWAIVVLVVVAIVGVVLAVAGRGRLAVAAAIAWGLVWIAVARLDEETFPSTPVAVTAIAVAVVVVGATVALRVSSLRRRA